MNYKIISFYTKNTSYEKEKEEFIKSCEKYNIPFYIYPIENQKAWTKNCQQKAEIILDALENNSKNILYTDIDSRINKSLNMDIFQYCDFACHFLDNELLSGTLYFNNCDKCKILIKEWIKENEIYEIWDQINLKSVLKRIDIKLKLNTLIMPDNYCRIFDNQKQKCELNDAYIIHYQKSRTYKREIDVN
jgi:hypothetical protein